MIDRRQRRWAIILWVTAWSYGVQAVAVTDIKIGILHSLTGTMAISERRMVDAALLAIDEINQSDAIPGCVLVPVVEDGASDWPTFALKAEKLIVEDGVSSIMGCWTSASRKAVLPVVEKYNHLLWYPVQYEGNESSPNIIYTGIVPNQQLIPAIDWCYRRFGRRFFLVGSDYMFPRTANHIVRQHLELVDAMVVGEAYRPLGDQDFTEIVEQIRESEADIVLNTVNGDSNIAFFEALRHAGIGPAEIPVMSFSIAEHEIQRIGIGLVSGHYCAWSYFQSNESPSNRRFVNMFKQRYGQDRVTDDPTETAYAQVYLFAEAVRRTGTPRPAAVREATRGLVIEAPSGLIRIDPLNQHTWKVARIGLIKGNGQLETVWCSNDPLPPMPYLKDSFAAECSGITASMFQAISRVIELERTEAVSTARKNLLLAMADTRGYLGMYAADFRLAIFSRYTVNQRQHWLAWEAFVARFRQLDERQGELNPAQVAELDRFRIDKDRLEALARQFFVHSR